MKEQDRFTVCETCGGTIPEERTAGLCPVCLLAGGVGPDIAEGPEEEFIGPFLLLEKLGEGGMGMVWRARQLEPVEREVALKVIKPGMDSREAVRRFELERQSLALMDHPNIARVFEAGMTERGRLYFAMELVEGVPVTCFCREGGLALPERLEIFKEACEAVSHAHRKGVIHRDLKPGNLLVREVAGKAGIKVIDFGIARAFHNHEGLGTFQTIEGQVVGTPGYMSPEQAAGWHDLDTRTDVYALGAILYELSTGLPPHGEALRSKGLVAMMKMISEEDPELPRQRTSLPFHIPRDLEWIIMQALSRDRNQRYESVEALRDDLGRLSRLEPVRAAPPSRLYRCGKFVRKHRLPLSFVAGLVMALAVGLVLVLREADRARRAENVAQWAGERARAEQRRALATLADSYTDAGLRESLDGGHAVAGLWFTMASGLDGINSGQNEANRLRAALHRAKAALPVRFLPFQAGLRDRMVFDRTSSFFRVEAEGRHHFFDLESGGEVTPEGDIVAATWYGGGPTALIATGEGKMSFFDFRTRNEREAGIPPGGPVSFIKASVDGDQVIYGDRELKVWVWDEKREVALPGSQLEGVIHADFSDDGTAVLTLGRDGIVRVFLLESQGAEAEKGAVFQTNGFTVEERFLPRFDRKSGAIWCKRESHLLLIDGVSGQVIREVATGQPLCDVTRKGDLCLGRDGLFQCPGGEPIWAKPVGKSIFSPDGSLIYSSQMNAIFDQSGRCLSKVPPGGPRFCFSEDGDFLAVANERGCLIMRTRSPGPFLETGPEASGKIAMSDDGRLIASAGWSSLDPQVRKVRAFTTRDGRPYGPSIKPGGVYLSGAFCARSSDLVTGWKVGKRGRLIKWDTHTGELLGEPLEIRASPLEICRHPHEGWFAVLCDDGVLLRVDGETAMMSELARVAIERKANTGRIDLGQLAFSGDGTVLFVDGLDDRLRAFRVGDGSLLFRSEIRSGEGLALKAAGGYLLSPTRASGDPWVFETGTGRAVKWEDPFRVFFGIGSSFDSEGRRVLLSASDCVASYDLQSRRFEGSRIYPGDWGVAFSNYVSGNSRVLTAYAPGRREAAELRLWDLRDGRDLGPRWNLPGGDLVDAVLTPDGRFWVLSQGEDGFVVVKVSELNRAKAAWRRFDPQQRLKLAELTAGHRVIDGRPVLLPSPEDWAEIWERARALVREGLPLRR